MMQDVRSAKYSIANLKVAIIYVSHIFSFSACQLSFFPHLGKVKQKKMPTIHQGLLILQISTIFELLLSKVMGFNPSW